MRTYGKLRLANIPCSMQVKFDEYHFPSKTVHFASLHYLDLLEIRAVVQDFIHHKMFDRIRSQSFTDYPSHWYLPVGPRDERLYLRSFQTNCLLLFSLFSSLLNGFYLQQFPAAEDPKFAKV